MVGRGVNFSHFLKSTSSFSEAFEVTPISGCLMRVSHDLAITT
jgi:hypothetical protein